MKISYRGYPILEKLHKGILGNIPIFETDLPFFKLLGDKFTGNWKFYHKDFNTNVNIISNTFVDAANKAMPKLMDLYGDIMKNDLSDFEIRGTFVIGEFVNMISYSTKKGSEDNEISFFVFDKKGVPLLFYNDSAKHEIHQNGWLSKALSEGDTEEIIRQKIYKRLMMVIIVSMFKTYAEVETKIIPPNSKVKGIDCKYVNDTKLKLTYLDSKWFTNLVKSDGFNVRGHFRLQPKKKDGVWTKELIWINEFIKTGYTAPARILKSV